MPIGRHRRDILAQHGYIHISMSDVHHQMMQRAIELAQEAAAAGEVPVGAVLYRADGTVLGEARNRVEELKQPTAHAEMLALQAAHENTGEKYFEDAVLAVTLEPCAMCAQALSHSRVGQIRFGAYDVKSGGTVNGARVLEHAHFKPEVLGGLEEAHSAQLLKDFFKDKR